MEKISSFAERLTEALENESYTDIAQKIGLSKQAISSYTTGARIPKRPTVVALASLLKVDFSWLCGYDVPKIPRQSNSTESTRATVIPVLGTVAAGIPIEAVEDVLDYEEITPEMAASGRHFGLRIKGSSMEPRILEGDVVIVRCQPSVESGEVAIVQVNGNEATCKRVVVHENGLSLIAYNSSVYSPHFYTMSEVEKLPVQIIGKVVELRGKF